MFLKFLRRDRLKMLLTLCNKLKSTSCSVMFFDGFRQMFARWIRIRGQKWQKKIQQGRQRLFTEFSSARGAIQNSAEHNGGRVTFIFDNDRRHYYSDVKKRNSKKYWKLGIWWIFKVWNFKIFRKFWQFFFEFSILFRKYDRLVSRVVLWFVEASILGSLAKKSWKNL